MEKENIRKDIDNLYTDMIKVIEGWSSKVKDNTERNNLKHNALRRFGLQKIYKSRGSNGNK